MSAKDDTGTCPPWCTGLHEQDAMTQGRHAGKWQEGTANSGKIFRVRIVCDQGGAAADEMTQIVVVADGTEVVKELKRGEADLFVAAFA